MPKMKEMNKQSYISILVIFQENTLDAHKPANIVKLTKFS